MIHVVVVPLNKNKRRILERRSEERQCTPAFIIEVVSYYIYKSCILEKNGFKKKIDISSIRAIFPTSPNRLDHDGVILRLVRQEARIFTSFIFFVCDTSSNLFQALTCEGQTQTVNARTWKTYSSKPSYMRMRGSFSQRARETTMTAAIHNAPIGIIIFLAT